MKIRTFAASFFTALFCISAPVMAQTSLKDIQDLPSAAYVPANPEKAFDQKHWAYKTLQDVTKKYGLLIGESSEKFDGNKPITRNEAAVIFVNLMGKIEQDNLTLSEAEKARLEILKSELNNEIQKLAGRVDKLELL